MTLLEVIIWTGLIAPVVGMVIEHVQLETVNHEYWKQRVVEK